MKTQAEIGLVPTIGVDFDGTICDFAYPDIGSPKPGVKEALTRFKELGYRVVIWTCRACHYHYDVFGTDPSLAVMDRPSVKAMKAYLEEHEIPFDEIDDNSRGKLHAEWTIDDRAIHFGNNWPEIVKFIEATTK